MSIKEIRKAFEEEWPMIKALMNYSELTDSYYLKDLEGLPSQENHWNKKYIYFKAGYKAGMESEAFRKIIEERDRLTEINLILWDFLKEQHRFRVEDELNELEIEDSWSCLCNRVNKYIATTKGEE